MNTLDQIAYIMKHGGARVTFALTQTNEPLIAVEQTFATENGQSKMLHETMGASYAEALEAVAKSVYHCAALQIKSKTMARNSN